MKRRLFVLAIAVVVTGVLVPAYVLKLKDRWTVYGESGDRENNRDASNSGAGAVKTRPTAAGTFRIATYNILYVNKDLKAIAATIRKSRADLVCLQETNNKSARFLRKELKGVYPHAHFSRSSGPGGFAFLSKTPLKKIQYLPRKFGHFGTLMCQVELAGKTVQIVNVHLIATNPGGKRNPWALLKLLGRTELARARQIAHIHGKLPEKMPVVLAGDLNSLPDWAAPTFLKSKGLIDSLASARKDHKNVVTWKWARKGASLALRIDYIFHTADIRTLAGKVLTSSASDHYLQVSTMRWAPKAASQPATRPAASPAGRARERP